MAPVSFVARTCGILVFIILQVQATENYTVEPWIESFQVESKSCVDFRCKYLLLVNGGEFLGHYSLRLTSSEGARGSNCDKIYPNYELREIETSQWFTKVEIFVPKVNEKLYFCLRYTDQRNTPVGAKSIHQGVKLFLHPEIDSHSSLNGANR